MRRKKDDEISWDDEIASPTEEFLPDEAVQEQRLASNDLRDRIARLETQMMAQYTAMAAYAQIAQNNTEAARAESRSDLDRSQSTVIGLIERVRRECADAIQGVEVRAGGGEGSDLARLAALEERFDGLAAALERSIDTTRALAEQVAVLIDEKMQREGWLVANGNSEELSLH
ncbi:MAG: hypothetical protein H6514_03365 [Acidimicrobiaceae bacterium]|nr:hypothetical protein [Acidimicrobiaceae bacterium]